MTDGVFAAPDLHRLMFGLLYPAVLGTFFFSLLPVLFGTGSDKIERPSTTKTLTGCLVVLHFIVDFHLASSLPPKEYSLGGFILDLLILGFLFRAFNALNICWSHEPLSVRGAATAIAMTYGLFLVWSFLTLEVTLERLPLWTAEAAGLIVFIIVRSSKSISFLCWSLIIFSSIMAVLGSMAVGSL